MTSNIQALQNYLNELEAKQISDGATMTIITDVEHWISFGIDSVEKFKHYEAQSCHYDLFKEIHNIRPRWFNYAEMSAEQIWAEVDKLFEEMKAIEQREKEERDQRSRDIQQRKAKNKYKPNLAFSGLREMIEQS